MGVLGMDCWKNYVINFHRESIESQEIRCLSNALSRSFQSSLVLDPDRARARKKSRLSSVPARASAFVQNKEFCSSINLALVPVLSSVKFVFDKFRPDAARGMRRESIRGLSEVPRTQLLAVF